MNGHSDSEPFILTILSSKLQQDNPKFFETVSFMHKQYSEYLTKSINGNAHIMDLVNAWCKMSSNYKQEIQFAKDNLLDDRIVDLAVENRKLKKKLRELEEKLENPENNENNNSSKESVSLTFEDKSK